MLQNTMASTSVAKQQRYTHTNFKGADHLTYDFNISSPTDLNISSSVIVSQQLKPKYSK